MVHRKYSDEFKREAIRLVTEQKITIKQAAQDLGIAKSTLDEWLKTQRQAILAPHQASEEAELKRLRKENQTLRMERDILKKATAYFAKHSA